MRSGMSPRASSSGTRVATGAPSGSGSDAARLRHPPGRRIGVAPAGARARAPGAGLGGVAALGALAARATGANPGRTVLAVLDARRGEAFAAAWHGARGVLPPAAFAPAALAELACAA